MIEAIVGFLSGIIASMGMGGGFILMIYLAVFTDVEQRAAQGINVLFFLPIAVISVLMHLKSGLIDKRLVLKCCVGGIIGAIIGTYASVIIPNELLRKLFAVFLLAFGLREFFRKTKAPADDKSVSDDKNA